jgi:hypothetical protein
MDLQTDHEKLKQMENEFKLIKQQSKKNRPIISESDTDTDNVSFPKNRPIISESDSDMEPTPEVKKSIDNLFESLPNFQSEKNSTNSEETLKKLELIQKMGQYQGFKNYSLANTYEELQKKYDELIEKATLLTINEYGLGSNISQNIKYALLYPVCSVILLGVVTMSLLHTDIQFAIKQTNTNSMITNALNIMCIVALTIITALCPIFFQHLNNKFCNKDKSKSLFDHFKEIRKISDDSSSKVCNNNYLKCINYAKSIMEPMLYATSVYVSYMSLSFFSDNNMLGVLCALFSLSLFSMSWIYSLYRHDIVTYQFPEDALVTSCITGYISRFLQSSSDIEIYKHIQKQTDKIKFTSYILISLYCAFLALIHQSSLIGYISVYTLFQTFGFRAFGGDGFIVMGYDEKYQVYQTSGLCLSTFILYYVLQYIGLDFSYLRPFESAVHVLGTTFYLFNFKLEREYKYKLIYFLNIIACWIFGNYSNQNGMTNTAIVFGILFLFNEYFMLMLKHNIIFWMFLSAVCTFFGCLGYYYMLIAE